MDINFKLGIPRKRHKSKWVSENKKIRLVTDNEIMLMIVKGKVVIKLLNKK